MHRIRIKYKKGGWLVFIGHLDMVRLWERAIRRADIPVIYSQGFNPRQKLSFGPPLSLGIASDCEFLDIYSDKWMNPEEIKERLRGVLPSGIEIIETSNVFEGLPSLSAAITTAEYSGTVPKDIKNRIDEILGEKELMVKRKDKSVNIRRMIKKIALNNKELRITVQCDNFGSLKAAEIKELFPDIVIKDLKRAALY